MQAEIISIGDELLLGQTVNTNAAWMGEALHGMGCQVIRVTTVQDEEATIVSELEGAMSRVDVVLLTGGLGPTRDDKTKATLAAFFGMELVMNDRVLEEITAYFTRRSLPMLDVNRDQAVLPAGCEILSNPRGTAQGMWFECNGKAVVSLPGVPHEMKGIMKEEVLPRFATRFQVRSLYKRTVLTHGMGEAFISKRVDKWEVGLKAKGVDMAYLPHLGQVRIRLSAWGTVEDADRVKALVDSEVSALVAQIPDHVVSTWNESLPQVLGGLLADRGWKLASAESCTGGRIGAALTAVSGSSAYFLGGTIAYANEIKTDALGVPSALLAAHGAVSEPVVRSMAEGALRAPGADLAVATSGVAGPSGGTVENPVGTVWIAVATAAGTAAFRHVLAGNRNRITARAVDWALAHAIDAVRSAGTS
jgi:nicotinamide-nucleotide amidase